MNTNAHPAPVDPIAVKHVEPVTGDVGEHGVTFVV